jgi:glycosyltransferase involved in cell wall biosynthesis
MRLAVEISTCSEGRTGIGYYTEHFVDALIATRSGADEVVLISNGKPAPELYDRWRDRLRIGGIPVRAVWMQRDANRLLIESGADFAMFPNYLAPLNVACPFINVVHDLAIIRTPQFFNFGKLALQRPLLPWIVRRAAAVGTVSAASRRDITELLGVPEHRVLMLPGAPHPACAPPPASEVARVRQVYGLERRYIVSVGTLEPRKNLPTLVDGFQLLRRGRPELTLALTGLSGWERRNLAAEGVRLLGYVPDEELARLYRGASAFAYSSQFEGFGIPVVEALACGVSAVVSSHPSLDEASGDVALRADPDEPEAFAAALEQALGEPAGMRERGLAHAARFTWRALGEAVLAGYEQASA